MDTLAILTTANLIARNNIVANQIRPNRSGSLVGIQHVQVHKSALGKIFFSSFVLVQNVCSFG